MCDYKLKKPCDNCPFLKETPLKLTKARVVEIAGMMLDSQGGTFPCHKTVDYAEEDKHEQIHNGTQHCAGALIFAMKNDTMPQLARIAYRLGLFDPEPLMADQKVVDSVFDDVKQMIKRHGRRSFF